MTKDAMSPPSWINPRATVRELRATLAAADAQIAGHIRLAAERALEIVDLQAALAAKDAEIAGLRKALLAVKKEFDRGRIDRVLYEHVNAALAAGKSDP